MNHYNRKKGILYIILAAFCFSSMTLCVRLAGNIPTMEKCMFRNLPALFIAFIVLRKEKESYRNFKKDQWIDLFFRCFFGSTGMVFNFLAIDHIGLADANMLNKMSPFFAMFFSVFLLKEIPSKFEWFLLALAFGGAVLVVKPSGGMNSIYHFVGLYSGLGAGIAYTFVRRLGIKGVQGPLIVFAFSLSTCLLCLPFMVLNYTPMSLGQFFILLLAGLFGAGGQFSITAAYESAPAKEISVFDYTQVLFAALLGLVFFGEFPDSKSLLGYAIIIGAAVVKWKSENQSKAEIKPPQQ